MRLMNSFVTKHVCAVACAISVFMCADSFSVVAQTTRETTQASSSLATAAAPSRDDKAEGILQKAVEALGGKAYLEVKTIIGRGFYTQFQDGRPDLPTAFVDYLVLPDRQRTEFRGAGKLTVQSNTGDAGWIYDGAARTLRDMKPDQVADFQRALRTSLDNILRGWWRKENARLEYVGRREAGLARRNEVVKLSYPDSFTVEFEFGSKDGLPAKTIYKRPAAAAGAEGEAGIAEEDRFAKYLTSGNVMMPFVVDHFRGGVQSSRINYDTIDLNKPILDSMFARPADTKAFK